MAEPVRVRRLTGQEGQRLQQIVRRGSTSSVRYRRAMMLLASAGGAANRKKRGSADGRPVAHDAEQYKERNTVERCINKIRAWRGLVTRYDKTPASYMAGLQLRGSIIWIRSLNPGSRSRRPAGEPEAATAQVRPAR